MPERRLARTRDAYDTGQTRAIFAQQQRERCQRQHGWRDCAGCRTLQPPSHVCQVYLPDDETERTFTAYPVRDDHHGI